MASAAVGAAGMAFAVVGIVVAATGIGIIIQGVCQEAFHSLVCVAGAAAVDGNTGIRQGKPGAAADAAANQDIDTLLGQQTSQCAVAAAVGVDHLGGQDFSILSLVELEGGGMAKMLEDVSGLIGNCDFHINSPSSDLRAGCPRRP